jgi:hypothetical protein
MARLDRAITPIIVLELMARSSRTMTFKGQCHRSMVRAVGIIPTALKTVLRSSSWPGSTGPSARVKWSLVHCVLADGPVEPGHDVNGESRHLSALA